MPPVIVLFALLAHTLALQTSDLPRRGMLGLSLVPLTADAAKKADIKPADGLLVAAPPLPGGTAAAAGLQQGDVILSIDGKTPKITEVAQWARGVPVGEETTFEIDRDGKHLIEQAKWQEKPRDPGNERFKVRYSSVNTVCGRMRTIITEPTAPGKHPGILFIQGYSPISYDYTLETAKGDISTLDGPLLFDLADSNFVLERVEKPGVGDSEGGPFRDVDFTNEEDIYRQALKQLRENPLVDTDNIFIFGHSMGGAFGPAIAAETPVKGMAMYGVATRNWFQYLIDTLYYQDLVAGSSYSHADDQLRQGAQIMALVMLEDKSPSDVKTLHPELSALTDELFPNGLFSDRSLTFWRQLCHANFEALWEKANCHALAVHGGSDFVSYATDHKLIADIVNHEHPGWGKWESLPNSDHLFQSWPTEADSLKNFGKGQFTNDFAKVLKDWIGDVMAGKA